MAQAYPLLILGLSGIVLVFIFYVFSRFDYTVSPGTLRIKGRMLRSIPFKSRTVKIAEIDEIRNFELRDGILGNCQVLGNLFFKKGLIIVLKNRSFFIRKIYVTPNDTDEFLKLINAAKMK